MIRKSDGSRFAIPYNRLSAKDQSFVLELPLYAAILASSVPSADEAPENNSEREILNLRQIKLREVKGRVQKNETLLRQIGPAAKKVSQARAGMND
jgi:hypothetical protein